MAEIYPGLASKDTVRQLRRVTNRVMAIHGIERPADRRRHMVRLRAPTLGIYAIPHGFIGFNVHDPQEDTTRRWMFIDTPGTGWPIGTIYNHRGIQPGSLTETDGPQVLADRLASLVEGLSGQVITYTVLNARRPGQLVDMVRGQLLLSREPVHATVGPSADGTMRA